MAQPQQQQFKPSGDEERRRALQAAGQSDHDPHLETALDRVVYAYGVATGQIDPTRSILEQAGTVIELPDAQTSEAKASGIMPPATRALLPS
jgi:hypothetical protein